MKTNGYELPKGLIRQAMRESGEAIYASHISGVFDEGDPNHPMYNDGINYLTGKPATLFGYETNVFLKKQYK